MPDFDNDPPKKKRVYRPKVVHEDDEEDRPSRRRTEPRYTCPFCGTHEEPQRVSKVSGAGWVVFVLFLLFCCILAPFGLLIREEYDFCPECLVHIG